MVSLLVESGKSSGNSHRGRLDIIADILEASYCETRKTYLMYRCNMSFKQLKSYLDFLLRKELLHTVTEDVNPNSGLFKITEKGKEFLRVYKGLRALVK
jgi:predicted transcriptional regulator